MARVALVTGGTRGIGAAISRALKEAGYTVAANYAGNDEAAAAFSALEIAAPMPRVPPVTNAIRDICLSPGCVLFPCKAGRDDPPCGCW